MVKGRRRLTKGSNRHRRNQGQLQPRPHCHALSDLRHYCGASMRMRQKCAVEAEFKCPGTRISPTVLGQRSKQMGSGQHDQRQRWSADRLDRETQGPRRLDSACKVKTPGYLSFHDATGALAHVAAATLSFGRLAVTAMQKQAVDNELEAVSVHTCLLSLCQFEGTGAREHRGRLAI